MIEWFLDFATGTLDETAETAQRRLANWMLTVFLPKLTAFLVSVLSAFGLKLKERSWTIKASSDVDAAIHAQLLAVWIEGFANAALIGLFTGLFIAIALRRGDEAFLPVEGRLLRRRTTLVLFGGAVAALSYFTWRVMETVAFANLEIFWAWLLAYTVSVAMIYLVLFALSYYALAPVALCVISAPIGLWRLYRLSPSRG